MAYNKPNFPATLDPSNPINNGLLGCWLFNEGAGLRAFDISGKKNHGTLTGGPKWTAGKSGRAVNLDGTDDYVLISTNLPITNPSFCAWIKHDTSVPAYNEGIVLKYDYGVAKRVAQLYLSSSGTVGAPAFVTSSDGTFQAGNVIVGTTALNDGKWHFVCGVYDETFNRVYIDGVLNASVDRSNDGIFSTSLVTVFGTQWTTGAPDIAETHFSGEIGDVRVYNRPLSLSEIQRLYAEPFAGIAVPNRLPVMNSLSAAITRVWAAVFG